MLVKLLKNKIKEKNYDFIVVFTYHPLSSFIEGQKKLNQIYQAFKKLSESFKMRIIITGVNADIGGDMFLNLFGNLNLLIRIFLSTILWGLETIWRL